MMYSQSNCLNRVGAVRFAVCLVLLVCCGSVGAQTNNWISSRSGAWESAGWSLGLPGTNQDIFLANASAKVVVIDSATAQNYPQTLSIQSLTISSSANSPNEVLMNGAGLDSPLNVGGETLGSLLVGNNSVFVMQSSALQIQNEQTGPFSPFNSPGAYGAFSVGGIFNESDGSQVSANFLNVGDIGPGVFNLTNSSLTVPYYEIVGGLPSVFNQDGGTNSTAALILTGSGEYDLYNGALVLQNLGSSGSYDGQYDLQITFQGGHFNQWGGNVAAGLFFQSGGRYNLAGGNFTLNGGLTGGGLTMSGGFLYANNLTLQAGSVVQTGGTNYAGAIAMYGGGSAGPGGGYNLSGGLLNSTSVNLGMWTGVNPGQLLGYGFTQSAGDHTTGTITVQGTTGYEGAMVGGSYNLSGGTLEAGGVNINIGSFNQSGGTNQTGTISLNEGSYTLSGGKLSAGNIQINTGSMVKHIAGEFAMTGILTLINGTWQEATNGAQLGQLILGAGSNSTIQLSTNACVLQFADSSGLNWSANSALTVLNWSGSAAGGGAQQIIFGNNSTALTAQQLGQVQFANPAGFAPGNYVAKMLGNGEIVPSGLNANATAPAPFFAGEAALGSGWFYLATSPQNIFGYYNMGNFPYIFHQDMGWEYFVDAKNAAHGGYFYDFADGAFFYTEPGTFPYLYDFTANSWVYYAPENGTTDHYSSNPRWFYNLATQTWGNHL
jgi:hypothetical protein